MWWDKILNIHLSSSILQIYTYFITQSFYFYIFTKRNASIYLYSNNFNLVFHLSIKRRMGGNVVGHAYHRILSGITKEWTVDTIPTWRILNIITLKCTHIFSEFKIIFFVASLALHTRKQLLTFYCSPNSFVVVGFLVCF